MRLMWRSKKRSNLLKLQSEDDAWQLIPEQNIVGDLKYTKSGIVRSKREKALAK